MINFAIGTLVGAIIVGSSVQRTISVARAHMSSTLWHSALNSVSYYYSVKFVAHDNLDAFLGTCLGSTLVVMLMVLRNKKLKKDYNL